MAKANVRTVPHKGGWANRREGAERVSRVFKTKAEAEAAGLTAGMREKAEQLIQWFEEKSSDLDSAGIRRHLDSLMERLTGVQAVRPREEPSLLRRSSPCRIRSIPTSR